MKTAGLVEQITHHRNFRQPDIQDSRKFKRPSRRGGWAHKTYNPPQNAPTKFRIQNSLLASAPNPLREDDLNVRLPRISGCRKFLCTCGELSSPLSTRVFSYLFCPFLPLCAFILMFPPFSVDMLGISTHLRCHVRYEMPCAEPACQTLGSKNNRSRDSSIVRMSLIITALREINITVLLPAVHLPSPHTPTNVEMDRQSNPD